jgi:hypothetical protein
MLAYQFSHHLNLRRIKQDYADLRVKRAHQSMLLDSEACAKMPSAKMSWQRYRSRDFHLDAHWLSAHWRLNRFGWAPSQLLSWKRLNAAHARLRLHWCSRLFVAALQLLLKFNLLVENRS